MGRLSALGEAAAEYSARSEDRLARTIEDLQPPIRVRLPRVVIAGLPRTGGTTLQHSLAAEDGSWTPLGWHCVPDGLVTLATDPRAPGDGAFLQAVYEARERQELVEALLPKVAAMHPLRWDRPEECTPLLSVAGPTFQHGLMFGGDDLWQEAIHHDASERYDIWQACLDIVESFHAARGCRSSVLKSPVHLGAGYASLCRSLMPQDHLVHVRRDAVAMLESLLNMTLEMREAFVEAPHRSKLGPEILEAVEAALRRSTAALQQASVTPSVIDIESLPSGGVIRITSSATVGVFAHVRVAPQLPYERLPLAVFGLTSARVYDVLGEFDLYVSIGGASS